MYDLPDDNGHFGQYGGVFVAETLIEALDQLKAEYEHYRNDPVFRAEFEYELKHYVGRPSPVYHAKRWSVRRYLGRCASESRLRLNVQRDARKPTPYSFQAGGWERG